MSMEIIEKPTHKCSGCGCVFSFDREDLKKISVICDTNYVVCPVCRTHDIAFKDNEIEI